MNWKSLLIALVLILATAIGVAIYNASAPVTAPALELPPPEPPRAALPPAPAPTPAPVVAAVAPPPPSLPTAYQLTPEPDAEPAPPPPPPAKEEPEPTGPVHPLAFRGLHAAVMPRMPQLRDCWEDWHKVNPAVQTDFDISMRISATGKGTAKLSRVTIKSKPAGHLAMEQCIVNALKDGRFEVPKLGEYEATYPLSVSPN